MNILKLTKIEIIYKQTLTYNNFLDLTIKINDVIGEK